MTILYENKLAIIVAHDPVYRDKIKHVDVDLFYMKDNSENTIIYTLNVSTLDQCVVQSRPLPDYCPSSE